MKKTGVVATLSISVLAFALLSPNFAEAQTAQGAETPALQSNVNTPSGQNEAIQMVPARAALVQVLDAKKMRQGEQFNAKLSQAVQLKNGPKLPSGTELIGMVGADDMQTAGSATSRLVLRFTEAKLKDGKVVPIKATIVGVFGPGAEDADGYDVVAGDQQPNPWSAEMLQVDQIGAVAGVDLHSKIASDNSGVFVSNKKDDVKLSRGSELALAIAPQGNSQAAVNGQNTGN